MKVQTFKLIKKFIIKWLMLVFIMHGWSWQFLWQVVFLQAEIGGHSLQPAQPHELLSFKRMHILLAFRFPCPILFLLELDWIPAHSKMTSIGFHLCHISDCLRRLRCWFGNLGEAGHHCRFSFHYTALAFELGQNFWNMWC